MAILLVSCDLEIWRMLWSNRTPLLCHFKLCASCYGYRWIQAKVTVQKISILVKVDDLMFSVTLKFDGWPWKTTRQHFYTDSSFEQHFVAISVFKLELQCGNAQITSVTLTFNLWPWAFAWTPLLSMVITPENCMILWKERCEKGAMNGQTDGQTDRQTYGKNEGQRILVH